jgi:hypothetical protein
MASPKLGCFALKLLRSVYGKELLLQSERTRNDRSRLVEGEQDAHEVPIGVPGFVSACPSLDRKTKAGFMAVNEALKRKAERSSK